MIDGAYKLLAWFSPAMPIGAYRYSHGLEHAVEAGLVRDAPFPSRLCRDRAGPRRRPARCDLALRRLPCQPGRRSRGTRARRGGEPGGGMRGTGELSLESAAQGRALLTILRQAWPAAELEVLAALCRQHDIEPAHSVVAGVAAAARRLPLEPCVAAFLQSFAANLISAGVRLIPLGQTDGQRLAAALEDGILAVAAEALATSLDDLGTASPMIDLCAIAHETQYTRLFRS